MKISDLVANYIIDMLNEDEGVAEIQRNELANTLGCVPSQINYVITSRFTPEHGYLVESRRGGGGFIRIKRIEMTKESALMHIINSIGMVLDNNTALIMLDNMQRRDIIDEKTYALIGAAISERSFYSIPQILRDDVRAAVFKNMLLTLIR